MGKLSSSQCRTWVFQSLIHAQKLDFCHWLQILSLFSLKFQPSFISKKRSARCPNLNDHSLSLILPIKSDISWKKGPGQLPTQSYMSFFLRQLSHSSNVLYAYISLHNIIGKRCLLQGQSLIKVIIFTAASSQTLSETGRVIRLFCCVCVCVCLLYVVWRLRRLLYDPVWPPWFTLKHLHFTCLCVCMNLITANANRVKRVNSIFMSICLHRRLPVDHRVHRPHAESHCPNVSMWGWKRQVSAAALLPFYSIVL